MTTLPDRQNVSIRHALKLNRNSSLQTLLISINVPSCLNPSLRKNPPNRSEFITPKTTFVCSTLDWSVRGATPYRISFLSVWWKSFFFKKSNVACFKASMPLETWDLTVGPGESSSSFWFQNIFYFFSRTSDHPVRAMFALPKLQLTCWANFDF